MRIHKSVPPVGAEELPRRVDTHGHPLRGQPKAPRAVVATPAEMMGVCWFRLESPLTSLGTARTFK